MRTYASLAALLGWSGLTLQFVLTLRTANAIGVDPKMAVLNFFSFFTILTNILVVTVLTFSALGKKRSLFSGPQVQTAAAVFIFVVGAVYFFLLRRQWDPEGLNKLADVVLHYVMPAVYLTFWLAFTSKAGLHWRQVFAWQLYPPPISPTFC